MHGESGYRISDWLNKRKCDLIDERTVLFFDLPIGGKLSERILYVTDQMITDGLVY